MLKQLCGSIAIVSTIALTAVGLPAQAGPITVQLQADTTAVAESGADAHSDAGPGTAAPLFSSSVVVGATDFASGGAIATDGLLNTSAEAFSGSGFASGVGSSRYTSSFAGVSGAIIHLDFLTSDFSEASGASLATAILRVANGGTTLFEEVISLSGEYDYTVAFNSGIGQTVDLLLTSEAFTLDGGSAFNNASLAFTVSAVPEPSTLALVLVAFMAAGVRRLARNRGRDADSF